jgi:hypothetical protein
MKPEELVTNPEISKKIAKIVMNQTTSLGFWFELKRIYGDPAKQNMAEEKGKATRWEFNIPEDKIPVYEQMSFTDEIGAYRMKFIEKYPAFTMEELLKLLPDKVTIDDEYLRHIEIAGNKTKIYFKSKTTGFVAGDTIEDSDEKTAIILMIISIKTKGFSK